MNRLDTFRGTVHAEGGGTTRVEDGSWGAGDLLTTFAGYVTPPLLGLGGAALVVDGRSWSVLWAALVLLLAAVMQAGNGLATAVAGLALVGVGWAAVDGGPELQAAVAVGLVWLLLLGGVRATLILSRGEGSDPYWLARRTWVPRIVWQCVFVGIALLCLWHGGRDLLGL